MARQLSRQAYWDRATYFSESEGVDVLPASSLSVAQRNHYAPAPVEQTPRAGVGVVESEDSLGAVVRAERDESVLPPHASPGNTETSATRMKGQQIGWLV